jgi:glycosyltransferase involved in cell wall biosynthesis
MAKRKRIGLIYSYDENWVAGAYYVLNIIKALNYLPDNKKPFILVLHDNKELELVDEINYPFLKKYNRLTAKVPFLKRGVNKIARTFGGSNIFFPSYCSRIDYVYPAPLYGIKSRHHWIPDFQEDYYPELFSEEEVSKRKGEQLAIAQSEDVVVFSSNDALNDFKRLYPDYKCTTRVLHFSSVVSNRYSDIPICGLLKKYHISEPFFLAPNQFWAHKNHIIILKAIEELKKAASKPFNIVFTGKEHDFRNASYAESLKAYVSKNGLESFVKFIGFIDRDEQLQLMNHAKAVIQPSFFEGWSTVVEDAKALSKYIILSDIPVHREQVSNNVMFFGKDDYTILAKHIQYFLENHDVVIEKTDIRENVVKFAEDFLKIF